MSEILKSILQQTTLIDTVTPEARLSQLNQRRMTRRRQLAATALAASGSVIFSVALFADKWSDRGANFAAASECGTPPKNSQDTAVSREIQLTLSGPMEIKSGSQFTGTVTAHSADGLAHSYVVAFPVVYFVRDGAVVGVRDVTTQPAVALGLNVSATQGDTLSAIDLVEACPHSGSSASKDGRAPLAPGAYEIVVAVPITNDDGSVVPVVSDALEVSVTQ